ncbi:isochorismatase family protein [Janibacter limosus]|jgi:nicotinamidase-related amidase|uniref:isochorismatase family protein n=1 Tax=Janibacter limosus TaxID=53458 RepID=UPI000835A5B7|nr:isochorismatase family protein [Janibacter limosus]
MTTADATTSVHDAQTLDTYDRAGWGGSVDRGPRPALVVIDLTRGFTEPHFDAGSDLTQVVAATGRLIEAAHAQGHPVIFTRIVYSRAEVRPGAITWLTKAAGMRAMLEGSEGIVLDPRLPFDAATDAVVDKKGASAFHGTPLAALLRSAGCDTVVLTGATTSGCVRASAVDAVQDGFSVLVPREAVGDRAQGPHDANLFDINAKYGDVIDVADALDYLSGTPGHGGLS